MKYVIQEKGEKYQDIGILKMIDPDLAMMRARCAKWATDANN